MFPFRRSVVVHVEFPALDALVAYLRENQQQQQQIDSLSVQIAQATNALNTSTSSLKAAVQTQGA